MVTSAEIHACNRLSKNPNDPHTFTSPLADTVAFFTHLFPPNATGYPIHMYLSVHADPVAVGYAGCVQNCFCLHAASAMFLSPVEQYPRELHCVSVSGNDPTHLFFEFSSIHENPQNPFVSPHVACPFEHAVADVHATCANDAFLSHDIVFDTQMSADISCAIFAPNVSASADESPAMVFLNPANSAVPSSVAKHFPNTMAALLSDNAGGTHR
mmetsp:Transcript_296/g.538  ORF Transcript_296/g.538 Transcript_296/m.538 type:complete len:213 (+) Transcript_296:2730-3368(+)